MLLHRYTFFCEDFRIENNGKFIIIGLYTGGITTPQIPLVFPSLTFFQVFTAEEAGNFKFTATLNQLDNGSQLARAEGSLQPQSGTPIVVPIRLPDLRFMSFGTYTWSFQVEGQEPFLTEFTVSHVPVQPQMRVMPFTPNR